MEQNTSNESFTQEIYEESMDTLVVEGKKMVKRITKFLIKNILLIILKIIECSWMIGLSLISIPLKWNLQICQMMLDFFIKGICCIGCMACNCRRKQKEV